MTSKIGLALTLSRSKITHITYRANLVTSTRFTIRKIVIAIGTLPTVIATEIGFTWTLPIDGFTVITDGSVKIALTWTTVRISKVAIRTGVTIWWVELRSALATARFFFTVSSGVEVIAVARLANIGFIPMLSVWAEELVLTFVTVDTLGIVLAVLTDATPFVVAVDIQREVFLVSFLRVDTLSGMAVAVAWFALEWTSIRVLVPLLLFESWTTLRTLNTTSVVLTLTRQDTFCRTWI